MNLDEQAYLRSLLEKYERGETTAAETAFVEAYYRSFDIRQGITGQLDDSVRQALKHDLYRRVRPSVARPLRRRAYLPYAAAVLFIAAISIYFIINNRYTPANDQADIQPGGNRATLTLADGRIVELDSAQTGIIAGDNLRYADGSGILDDRQQTTGNRQADEKKSPMSDIPRLMSLTTPKGGTYQIVLSDGTRVWLNAASTLKYPSRFSEKSREVFLEGEGYFEVSQKDSTPSALRSSQKADNKEQPAPFIVRSTGQQITVLGTAFNISAYPDEQEIRTTLVNGAVKITATDHDMSDQSPITSHQSRKEDPSLIIKPGEQSILRGEEIQVSTVDVSVFTGWKNGEFVFRGTELGDAMKQLSRWYDLEVVYEGDVQRIPLYGSISRSFSLSRILDILKEGKVNFSIEQQGGRKKLIVKP